MVAHLIASEWLHQRSDLHASWGSLEAEGRIQGGVQCTEGRVKVNARLVC